MTPHEKNQQEIVFKLLFFCWDMHNELKLFLMNYFDYGIEYNQKCKLKENLLEMLVLT